MTTYVQARDALVTLINAAWVTAYPTTPIFYENTLKLDLDTVGSPFLKVSIDFTDAVQSDLDATPGQQSFGEVTFSVFAKEGTGERTQLGILDFLTTLMSLKLTSGVRTGVPAPGRKQEKNGWVSQDLVCPFMSYSKY